MLSFSIKQFGIAEIKKTLMTLHIIQKKIRPPFGNEPLSSARHFLFRFPFLWKVCQCFPNFLSPGVIFSELLLVNGKDKLTQQCFCLCVLLFLLLRFLTSICNLLV